jgi:hypothetical protein
MRQGINGIEHGRHLAVLVRKTDTAAMPPDDSDKAQRSKSKPRFGWLGSDGSCSRHPPSAVNQVLV